MLVRTMFANTTDNFRARWQLEKGRLGVAAGVYRVVPGLVVFGFISIFVGPVCKVLMGLDRGRCAAAADSDS